MPWTKTILARLAETDDCPGDQAMTSFRVINPTINADYGTVQARTGTDALDLIAAKMGWRSYDEYAAAAANHNGVRTLQATKVASN